MATPLSGVWGIDLGQCALKALRTQMIDGQVKATAFDYIEHAKILSQPDADPDQLVREALTQFLSRNSLKGDVVVISVPGQSGLARFVKLPPVEEKKIADIVKFEAKQQIPFPLEEVVWDFQKISQGEVTEGFALETEIGLFAMKRDMVNRSMQHFKDVGVEVHIIQMAPLALVNYVAHDLLTKGGAGEPGKRDCIVALDIGTDNSNLVITDGARIIWQRPIPLGGNHFTRALTKDMKLTFAKAEHLKRNAVKSPDLKKILASLKPVLNDFVGEVQRSLGYFTNTHRDANILYMVGLGNAFRLPGIQKYLQEKLQLEVRKLQSFDRVQGDEVLGAPQFSENVMSFGVPYGLALQGLKQSKLQTNLLPPEVRMERVVRGKKPWAVAAAAALLMAIAGLTMGQSLARSAVQNPEVEQSVKLGDAALAKAKSFSDQENTLKTQIEDSNQAIDRISAGVKERFQWQLLMQYVNMALPQPDGRKLTTRSYANNMNVKAAFLTDDALKALRMYEDRRFAKNTGNVDPRKAAEDEEFIKKNLVQMSIEGVNTLYSEELPVFFKKLYKDTSVLRGMAEQDKAPIVALASGGDDKSVPAKGHVIEIRGYTYHDRGEDFVIKTLLENLKKPEQDNVNDKGQITKEMKSQIVDHLGFFVLYKIEKVNNPEPGIFKLIRSSHLRALLKGDVEGSQTVGGMPNTPMDPGKANSLNAPGDSASQAPTTRDAWTPLGEVAAAALGQGTGSGGFNMGNMPGRSLGPAGDQERAPPPQIIMPGGPNAKGLPERKAVAIQRQPRYEFVVLFVWKDAPTALAAEERK